jgi:glycosyl hydrolase family 57
MTRVALVFAAHAPWRLRRYNYFDVGRNHEYFDREAMRRRIAGLDAGSLDPATALLAAALDRHPRLAFGLALSGPCLDQLALWAPARILAFRRLVDTGRVEPLAQTSHRSLLWSFSAKEVAIQIRVHRERLERHLGRMPRVFGGEEGGDPSALSAALEGQGFSGRLDIGANESELPPDPAAWLSPDRDGILPLRVNLATLGRSRAAGPVDELGRWIDAASASSDVVFVTPSEAVQAAGAEPPAPSSRPAPNELQRDARAALASLPAARPGAGDPEAVEDYRRLTGSDHFDAMALPRGGGMPANPSFDSPYEAYMAFRHAIADLELRFGGASPRRAPALRMPA